MRLLSALFCDDWFAVAVTGERGERGEHRDQRGRVHGTWIQD